VLSYGRVDAARQAASARFGFVILGMYPSMGVSTMQATINGIRAANPAVKIAQYTVLNEMMGTATTSNDEYASVTQITTQDWWVRDAAGAKVQWTADFNNFEVNLTSWAPADATGKRWPQWKAGNDVKTVFGLLSGIDYVFTDNTMFQPRYDADHMRVGTNQSRNDPAIQSAFRKGFVDFWTSLRAQLPGIKVMGNVDSDINQAEFTGQMEGAFNECLMGKSWSIESWGGWQMMMSRYRATLANTKAPNAVIFQNCPGTTVNLQQMRYGFASAMLENGYYAYTVDGTTASFWFDEFSAPLGSASEAPPTAASA
jgi:hypothetical protein